MLAEGGNMQAKAVPYFRKFCKHEQARVRAAAIDALASAVSGDMQEEMLAAINDRESEVRIAAAKAGFEMLNQARREAREKLRRSTVASPEIVRNRWHHDFAAQRARRCGVDGHGDISQDRSHARTGQGNGAGPIQNIDR